MGTVTRNSTRKKKTTERQNKRRKRIAETVHSKNNMKFDDMNILKK